jgi:xylose dehydrogenase (NAD/NADP)
MTFKIGIVGCGGHANTHGAAVKESSFAELVACADLDAEKAGKFAERHGAAHSYGSLQAMLENHVLDLLIIVAFPTVHPPLIKEAIAYGVKGIICEKPLAMNAKQAEEIAGLAHKHSTLIVEGLMYRSHPQFSKARELIAEGKIGEVRYIHAQFTDFKRPGANNWRNNRDLGGGSMTAKGCYLVDACNVFSGSRAKSAFCIESTDEALGGVEIGETGTIVYENGVTAHFETNHRSVWREEIKVCGTEGTLIIPHAIVTKTEPRAIELQRNGAYEAVAMQCDAYEFGVFNSYVLQLENVYRCIREGAAPNMPLADSITNYRVTDALMTSVRTGRLELIEWGEVE